MSHVPSYVALTSESTGTLLTENLTIPRLADVLSCHLIVLNRKRELLVNCTSLWKLPGGPVYQQNLSHYVEGLVQQLNSNISTPTLHAMIEYQKIRPPISFSFEDSDDLSDSTKYAVYYLAYIVDSPAVTYVPMTLPYFINGELKKNYFCRWSQIVELPLYQKHNQVLNFIYDPWKLQLVLDLDLTLLHSAQIGIFATYQTQTSYDIATPDDNLFKISHLPELMIDFQEYQQLRYVWTRPYLREFLILASKLTDLTYWTAGSELMQKRILKELKIDHYARHIFYHDSCTLLPTGFPYKSFTDINHKLETQCLNYQYDPQRCVLVDDSNLNYNFNTNNCYLIHPWRVTKSNSLESLESIFEDIHLMLLMSNLKKWVDQVIHEGKSASDILKPYQFVTPSSVPSGQDIGDSILPHMLDTPIQIDTIKQDNIEPLTAVANQVDVSASVPLPVPLVPVVNTNQSDDVIEVDPQLRLTESFCANLSTLDLCEPIRQRSFHSQITDTGAKSPVLGDDNDNDNDDSSVEEWMMRESIVSVAEADINLSDAEESDDDLPGYRHRLNQQAQKRMI
jgi:hypothetical protein